MEVKDTGINMKDSEVRKITGPYFRAELDPSLDRFKFLVKNAKQSFLEIGCGTNLDPGLHPRCSWGLRRGDLWVGCDRAIKDEGGKSVIIQKGASMDPDAKMVVFPDIAADIPKFQPDFISVVAPNPQTVGDVFNEELRPFLGRKKQVLAIVLDTRTVEAGGYLKEARKKISIWAAKYRFYPDETMALDFHQNSADLGARNITGYFVRNG